MKKSDAVMTLVSPLAVLKQIARAIPPDCRKNIIVIGSLAAGYHFFGNDPKLQVRTKDADCLLSPRIKAIPAGIKVTERLFQEKWRFRPDEKWSKPGDATVPDNELPAVRLNPPGSSNWFIELLTNRVTVEQLRLAGERLLNDAIVPLGERYRVSPA
jgi:hypothetical protein